MIKVIGFYSHIPFSKENNILYTPSFIGKYLHKLSFDEIDQLQREIYEYAKSKNEKFLEIVRELVILLSVSFSIK